MNINVGALQKPSFKPSASKTRKPVIKINIGQEQIPALRELIVKNYNRCSTDDVTGFFYINYYGKESKMTIDISAFKTLDAMFRTTGRLPEEMKAVFEMQNTLICNITEIRSKAKLTELLGSIKDDENKMLAEIADTLLSCIKS